MAEIHRRRPNRRTPFHAIDDDQPDLRRWNESPKTEAKINYRETIDLTISSDIDGYTSEEAVDQKISEVVEPPHNGNAQTQPITAEACLQMVLNVFPDMSVEHALKSIKERTEDDTRTLSQCEQLVVQLLDEGTYPREADAVKGKKRKREDSDDISDYENGGVDPEIGGYLADVKALLSDEFPTVPRRHIDNMLKEHKTLFKTYVVIEKQVRRYQKTSTPFSHIAKARINRGAALILIERGSQLPKELQAAKRKCDAEEAELVKAQEAEKAEQDNLHRAQLNDEMNECACCYEEVPINRMIACDGDAVHMYCVNCPRQQIETEIGQSRCRPKCFGVDDCNGSFSRSQLQQILSKPTFDRLEHMQQLEDLKAAGLDFLSECPFCDFQMECPPVEVDKEFRCQNPKCGKTSCRLCQKDSHIPLSCEEAKKDGHLTLRHVVEEAMSAALIRHCNRCKNPFIKEAGCNKMTCTHCRNLQCYVCSANVKDYMHFGESKDGKCPLHDNVESRHEEEIKKAAEEAMGKVRAENPNVPEADLKIQVSDELKRAEEARKIRAAQLQHPGHAFGFAPRPEDVPPPLPPPPPRVPRLNGRENLRGPGNPQVAPPFQGVNPLNDFQDLVNLARGPNYFPDPFMAQPANGPNGLILAQHPNDLLLAQRPNWPYLAQRPNGLNLAQPPDVVNYPRPPNLQNMGYPANPPDLGIPPNIFYDAYYADLCPICDERHQEWEECAWL